MSLKNERRGSASEALVEQALQTLIGKDQPILEPYQITEFIHAKQNSPLDRKHIDFLVKLEDGTNTFNVPIQVKSSGRGKRKFEKMCRRIGVFIPVIVVDSGAEIWQLIVEITKSLKQVIISMKHKAEKTLFLDRLRDLNQKRKEERPVGRNTENTRQYCVRYQPCFY